MLQAAIATHVIADFEHERWTSRGWETDWHIFHKSQKHPILPRSTERPWIEVVFHDFSSTLQFFFFFFTPASYNNFPLSVSIRKLWNSVSAMSFISTYISNSVSKTNIKFHKEYEWTSRDCNIWPLTQNARQKIKRRNWLKVTGRSLLLLFPPKNKISSRNRNSKKNKDVSRIIWIHLGINFLKLDNKLQTHHI